MWLVNQVIEKLGSTKTTMKIYNWVFFILITIITAIISFVSGFLTKVVPELLVYIVYNAFSILLWSFYNVYQNGYVKRHMGDKWYHRTLMLISSPVFLIVSLFL